MLALDASFINAWEQRYDEIESDEDEYRRLLDLVAADFRSVGTLRRESFLQVFRWKGAMRVIRHVRLDSYDSLYAPAFRRALSAPIEFKLAELLGDSNKLPGIGAPTGSTLLHFMCPEVVPIIDFRTVEVLHAAGLLKSRSNQYENYTAFRQAIEKIRAACPRYSLREIDRALFAFHKLELEPSCESDRARSCSA